MTTQRRSIMILLGAIAAGVLSVVMAMQWTNKKIAGSVTHVVVAARDIGPGEKLGSDNMRVMDWPRSSLVRGAAASMQVFDGRVTTQGLTAGEPILDQRLAANGSRPGLSAIITPGHRAMTVKVNEVVGVAGFALPGNYVDILVTLTHNGTPPMSRIVLERILVLAVAQDHTVKDESKPKVVSAVTLEVTPDQAERLDLARSVGSLSMVLRNQIDNGPVASRGAQMADITRMPVAPRRTMDSAVPGSSVEIIRGITRTSVTPG